MRSITGMNCVVELVPHDEVQRAPGLGGHGLHRLRGEAGDVAPEEDSVMMMVHEHEDENDEDNADISNQDDDIDNVGNPEEEAEAQPDAEYQADDDETDGNDYPTIEDVVSLQAAGQRGAAGFDCDLALQSRSTRDGLKTCGPAASLVSAGRTRAIH